MMGRTPQASYSTILVARPVRLLLATFLFIALVASLRWRPSAAVTETVSNYFHNINAPSSPSFPDLPTTSNFGSDDDGEPGRALEEGRIDKAPSSGHPTALTRPGRPDDVVQDKQHSLPPEKSPYAYVFYATADAYACSALVNIDRLQNKLKTKYPIYVLTTNGVSQSYIDAFKSRNVVVSIQQIPPLAEGSAEYYEGCLVKMLAFQMHHVNPALKRILAVDSDQLILKNLDSLFEGVPAVDLAAPRAYWIAKDYISSTFMLINLSDRLWGQIEPAIKNIQSDKYDMDLINDQLGETVLMLPGDFSAINSHWEAWDIPKWYVEGPKSSVTSAPVQHQTTMAQVPTPAVQQKAPEAVQRLPAGKGIEVKQDDDDGSPSLNKLTKRESGEAEHAIRQSPQSEHHDDAADLGLAPVHPPKPTVPKEERPEYHKLYDLYEAAAVLHFFALGKPWGHSFEAAQEERQDAHPLFYEQFKEWRAAAMELCPPGLIDSI